MQTDKLTIIQQLIETDDLSLLATIQALLNNRSQNQLTPEQRAIVEEESKKVHNGTAQLYTRDEVKNFITSKKPSGVIA